MRSKKAVIFTIFLCLALTFEGLSQRSGRAGKGLFSQDSRTQSRLRMPKNKGKIACPVFENSRYPYQGIGIKLGDPFAITYKFYLSERFGIVADFGKTASGLYNRYYREKFFEYINTDTVSGGGQIDYLAHRAQSDWVAELKFLFHIDASVVTPGLRVYVGVGPEIRSTKLEYQYFYYADGSDDVTTLGKFMRKRSTFGPQFSLGIEYSYFQIPISAFMELELFNDVSLDPGWRRFEGGVGLRYIF